MENSNRRLSAEETDICVLETAELVESDMRALAVLGEMADLYRVLASRPDRDSVPFGSIEQLFAGSIENALTSMVDLREAIGGALSLGAPQTLTAEEALCFLKQLSAEEVTHQKSLDQLMGEVAAGRGGTVDGIQGSFFDTRMALHGVLDDLRDRPGFAQCPTCRFEHGFWWPSEERREICSVCLEPADGFLAPCWHALCSECFGDLKQVPATRFDLGVICSSFQPAYREWAERQHPGEDYRSWALRCRALNAFLAQHKLCQKCKTTPGKLIEAASHNPPFRIEKCLRGGDGKAHGVFVKYVSKLAACAKNHRGR